MDAFRRHQHPTYRCQYPGDRRPDKRGERRRARKRLKLDDALAEDADDVLDWHWEEYWGHTFADRMLLWGMRDLLVTDDMFL